MSRGRPRKPDPTLPKHIVQASLPSGLYWDGRSGGRWFVVETDAAGRRTTRTVAGATALLSDLHAIAEARQGDAVGTLKWLCAQYEASPKFRALAPSTRKSYTKSGKVACAEPTKQGGTVGELQVRRFTRPLVQRLVDRIAAGHEHDADGNLVPTPTKAAHVLRYLSVVFRWGANRGHCEGNPAEGIEAPLEAKTQRMPEAATFARVVAYARQNTTQHGRGVRGQRGTYPAYLWAAAEIAYLCRLRGIEVATLTDAQLLPDGLQTNRRKGSRDNVVEWTPRLREAVDHLQAIRKAAWERHHRPTPIDPGQRPLIVAVDGTPLTKSGFDSAWQRMITGAIAVGVITEEQRFSMHGLKHRGVTDTPGNRADKQQASGHTTEAMVHRYDHELPRVQPAGSLRKIRPEDPV
jgi:integrase